MLSVINLVQLRNELRELSGFDYYVTERDTGFSITRSLTPLAVIANTVPYAKYIRNAKNNNENFAFAISPNKTTGLIIPVLDTPNITHFAKTYSKKLWLEMWSLVELAVKYYSKKGIKLYVSTHGHGVDQLHIRLEINPKNYDI